MLLVVMIILFFLLLSLKCFFSEVRFVVVNFVVIIFKDKGKYLLIVDCYSINGFNEMV